MDSRETNGRESGESFIRAISLLCALGGVWLVVAVAYAAWLGLFG